MVCNVWSGRYLLKWENVANSGRSGEEITIIKNQFVSENLVKKLGHPNVNLQFQEKRKEMGIENDEKASEKLWISILMPRLIEASNKFWLENASDSF
jgi:hypothetical protein